jgi:hypothetical protein
MPTGQLRQVVEMMEQLPAEEQDNLAAAIRAELEEGRRWGAAADDPHELVLDRLLDEAREQAARGEERDLDGSL